jgi:hypothetical protein
MNLLMHNMLLENGFCFKGYLGPPICICKSPCLVLDLLGLIFDCGFFC